MLRIKIPFIPFAFSMPVFKKTEHVCSCVCMRNANEQRIPGDSWGDVSPGSSYPRAQFLSLRHNAGRHQSPSPVTQANPTSAWREAYIMNCSSLIVLPRETQSFFTYTLAFAPLTLPRQEVGCKYGTFFQGFSSPAAPGLLSSPPLRGWSCPQWDTAFCRGES